MKCDTLFERVFLSAFLEDVVNEEETDASKRYEKIKELKDKHNLQTQSLIRKQAIQRQNLNAKQNAARNRLRNKQSLEMQELRRDF